jgi:predicted DNA-binding transcriptional regulator AlpA
MSPTTKKSGAHRIAHARAVRNADAQPFTPPPANGRHNDRLLLKQEVIDRCRLTYQAIWLKMRDGTFPKSVMCGSKAAWYESEIDHWLDCLQRSPLKGSNANSAEAAL